MSGVALFSHESDACRLDYSIECDAAWITRSARVDGFVGQREIHVAIAVANGAWTLNGVEQPQVRNCVDVDLNFSPSTNLLPIRRLALEIGMSASVRAAWLRFPSFALEPLDQTYTRTGDRTYRYESRTGFVAEIDVDGDGLPVRYGDIWTAR